LGGLFLVTFHVMNQRLTRPCHVPQLSASRPE
jgi:hypothetical protein